MSIPAALPLLSDDPAEADLLSFDAVAHTVTDALLDVTLDPIALGLSGSWGSGKTTVLGLVEHELARRSAAEQKVLVVRTDPWRYDPATGAKQSLIADVLASLGAEIGDSQSGAGKARELLSRLGKRVDWAKAVKLAATSSLTLQIPDFDKLVELVKPREDDTESVRGLEEFRTEFGELLDSKELSLRRQRRPSGQCLSGIADLAGSAMRNRSRGSTGEREPTGGVVEPLLFKRSHRSLVGAD